PLMETENENAVHDAIAEEIRKKLARQYREIKVNLSGQKQKLHEFMGQYPDLILSGHGMVLALVEIETENSITPDKINIWKGLAGSGPRLILMAPKPMKARLASMLWDAGLADKVSVGSYEISINMP
ncbi:MAG: hypothetical protein M0Z58_06485, partial [Nitrospiraceae bacterium]|nr:hypothetical protein [Nitrospiraceae bacterium]